jgi:hypothetical protein
MILSMLISMLYRKALAAEKHDRKQHIQHSMLLGMLPQKSSGGQGHLGML